VNSEIKYCYSDKTLSDYFVLHAGFKVSGLFETLLYIAHQQNSSTCAAPTTEQTQVSSI